MYEAPIKVLRQQIETEIEAEAMKAVLRLGVVVDKEELLKALEYDRGQYQKGYQDAVRHGRWYKPIGMMMPPEHHGRHRCSVCDHMAFYERPGRESLSDYCPNCGAKMDLEETNDQK